MKQNLKLILMIGLAIMFSGACIEGDSSDDSEDLSLLALAAALNNSSATDCQVTLDGTTSSALLTQVTSTTATSVNLSLVNNIAAGVVQVSLPSGGTITFSGEAGSPMGYSRYGIQSCPLDLRDTTASNLTCAASGSTQVCTASAATTASIYLSGSGYSTVPVIVATASAVQ